MPPRHRQPRQAPPPPPPGEPRGHRSPRTRLAATARPSPARTGSTLRPPSRPRASAGPAQHGGSGRGTPRKGRSAASLLAGLSRDSYASWAASSTGTGCVSGVLAVILGESSYSLAVILGESSIMSLQGGLYTSDDPACWRKMFNVYLDVIQVKGSKQKKLIALDKWYQEELPVAVAGRKEKYLTREELVKLMEWKLSRGKFRPRLQQLVSTNASETVEQCTKVAFQLLPDVEASITELSKLKAVGPATASAILAAGAPEAVAFMADEAVESIPGLTPVQYTLKHYMLYLDKIQGCVKKLNKADTEKLWTPHRVEMCLWAWAVADKLQLPSLPAIGATRKKSVRDAEGGKEPPKKQRRI